MALAPPPFFSPLRFPQPSSMSPTTLPARASLSPPLASSPPVFSFRCRPPPRSASFTRRPLYPSGGPVSCVPCVLSSAPMFWFAPPPWPVRLAVLVSSVVGGLRRRRPPRCPWVPWRCYRRRLEIELALVSGRGGHVQMRRCVLERPCCSTSFHLRTESLPPRLWVPFYLM